MHKVKFPAEPGTYLPLAILFVLLTLMSPRYGRFNYDYRKGSVWTEDNLIAGFDFPILKTAEQLEKERSEAASEIIPYYIYSERASSEMERNARSINLGDYQSFRARLLGKVSDISQTGVANSLEHAQEYMYIQKNKRASKYPVSEVYTIKAANEELLNSFTAAFPDSNADSLFTALGLGNILEANLEFDSSTTDLVHEKSVGDISPTSGVVTSGTLLISKGEIVTSEVQQLLDSYKAEYARSVGYDGPLALQWVGNALIALIITVLLFLSICYSSYEVFDDKRAYRYLLFVFFIATAMTFFVDKTNNDLLYMMPLCLTALYLLAFFKKRVVLPVYFISLLPMLFFSRNGVELFTMYLFAGVVCILTFSYLSRGWLQFINAVCIFFSLVFVWLSFRLVGGPTGFVPGQLKYLAIGSILTVAGYPFIYLFEKMFSLVSSTRLQELCDTNNRLLRELSQKAPGTFQHSLQVMNIADAACRAIDANVLLVRAGALYHDIGKTLNPQCFVENQTPGTNYHADISPEESARDILRHVTDGYDLAEKYNLPSVVSDFIITHHGTTCTAYFYDKYLKAGGSEDNIAAFRYKGRKPVTKEQVVLMLCDSIEAASRTLKDFAYESVYTLVTKITKGKMRDGQFEKADISIKELDIVQNVIIDYIMQMHHQRIAYPDKK